MTKDRRENIKDRIAHASERSKHLDLMNNADLEAYTEDTRALIKDIIIEIQAYDNVIERLRNGQIS